MSCALARDENISIFLRVNKNSNVNIPISLIARSNKRLCRVCERSAQRWRDWKKWEKQNVTRSQSQQHRDRISSKYSFSLCRLLSRSVRFSPTTNYIFLWLIRLINFHIRLLLFRLSISLPAGSHFSFFDADKKPKSPHDNHRSLLGW